MNGLFVQLTDEDAATTNGGLGAAAQALWLIRGIRNGGYRNSALGALAGQNITYTGGVRRVPLYLIFRRWW